MTCEKHNQWLDYDYCVFCALEDKYEERIAVLKKNLERLKVAWEQAINLYPDLESILSVGSEKGK